MPFQQPLLQPMRAPSTTSPHTPPHSAHSTHISHTASYDRLEEALLQPTSSSVSQLMRRTPLPQRRLSRSADNSPDVIKRTRHDNNNEQPQIHATDFSTKNNTHARGHNESGNNGNGISNSSSSPSPRLMEDVKNEPMELICPSNPDIDRSTDDTPPHHHRPLVSW